MNLRRCVNGHYYDGDKYSYCPTCAEEGAGAQGYAADAQGYGADAQGYAATEPADMQSYGAPQYDQPSYSEPSYNDPYGGGYSPEPGVTVPATDGYNPMGEESFGNIVDDYEGKTSPATLNGISGFTPVTGWLVCIDGPDRGKDFRIKPGFNYIGRHESMDICLSGDQKISRDSHAKVAYDDVERKFFFGPEHGADVVRVNGKLVMNQTEIHAYDIITIGSLKLIFIPLCGEKFSWE